MGLQVRKQGRGQPSLTSSLGKMNMSRRKSVRILIVSATVVTTVWVSGARLFAFPGESMVPAVKPGDHFLGIIGFWHFRTPKRFDMVIYDVPPASKWADRNIPWMKRVVGLPGEHVRFSGGNLLIDNRPVDASFLHRDPDARPICDFEVTLKRDEYFVLGDNLDHSFDDSRAMGPISRSSIKGFVAFVIHHS
jgi:signal peptidase I